MKETHEHLGHSITLALTRTHQQFGYTYFIDTQYCFEGIANVLDVDTARAHALTNAHRSIALLHAISPAPSLAALRSTHR